MLPLCGAAPTFLLPKTNADPKAFPGRVFAKNTVRYPQFYPWHNLWQKSACDAGGVRPCQHIYRTARDAHGPLWWLSGLLNAPAARYQGGSATARNSAQGRSQVRLHGTGAARARKIRARHRGRDYGPICPPRFTEAALLRAGAGFQRSRSAPDSLIRSCGVQVAANVFIKRADVIRCGRRVRVPLIRDAHDGRREGRMPTLSGRSNAR